MKTLSAPINIGLNITNKCNLSCKHCFASSTRNNKDLTTEELSGIIRQIIKLKVIKVGISGGEPLMRKDFWKILGTLNKAKTVITLNTNATLITRPIAKKLSRFPIRPYTVSLDGSLPEIHDSLRGRGAFEKTIKGIKNLVSQKLPVLISTTVTRLNYKNLYDIALLGKKLGVSKVRFNEVLCVGNAACFPRDLMLTADEKAGLLEIAEEIRNRFGKFATGTIFAGLEFIKKIKQMPRENFPLKARPCAAATTICDI